ncbi:MULTISPECIES: DUF4917 family protein [Sphingobium]|jgi:hypothetical protein|uniref:DUF4917 family protein n=1 Tax=Sphingobium TaxID=165695 RepID=UPI000E765A9C|nr:MULTISPECIES: DUF4917 family protein [Sphingobium]KAA9012170.1 DUF4917 family protein [Sphingobium limneticum]MBU0932684.1 DUF4917 family protein [Alphaproteobacteria bacterium]
MPVITFDQAIADSAQFNKRHLLLGNGFSIACRADIFHYGSLFSRADFSSCPEAETVFGLLNTQDFETAIRALENAATILPAYVPDGVDAIAKMQDHAAALKEILIQTIAGNHPAVPPEIEDDKFWACRAFLAHFLAAGGQVFTLNYDLLLYWTLMHGDDPVGDQINLATNDGFGNDEEDPDAEYVVWQGEIGAHDARVHFLHGALHLFDSGSELKKYTWIRKGVPLVEQARSAIDANAYPLFVAEGTSAQKKAKIRHNAYLYQGFKQFTANVKTGTHCFFVFGHSLATNDDHILIRMARGKFKKLYVGIYGDPLTEDNQRIMNRANELAAQRHVTNPLSVAFYDAATAMVWG